MVSPGFFAQELRRGGVDFYAGVPDSLLKSFCAWLQDNIGPASHIIAANEGAAVALAAGHYLASGRPGCVYMQNSGEGNAINPLASLTDADVYGIPVLLLIGWRGCPGVHDEPQHVKQGKVTLSLLETMGIPYSVLSADEAEVSSQIADVCRVLASGRTCALVVRKDTFSKFELSRQTEYPKADNKGPWLSGQTEYPKADNKGPWLSGQTEYPKADNKGPWPLDTLSDPVISTPDPVISTPDPVISTEPEGRVEKSLSRETAIQMVAGAAGPSDVIVSSTGMISRELFEFREAAGQGHERDFLTVGSMGHANQIALGISLEKPGRRVWCFDGDGAVIMHMGSMATVGVKGKSNFVHVVFNNGAHDSVGGQPTVGLQIDLPGIARACGYRNVLSVSTEKELLEALGSVISTPGSVISTEPEGRVEKSLCGPVFLEIKVRKGNRPDLGRPTTTPLQNRDAFMKFLK